MVHWVLPESCKPIAKSTVYAIPLADFANTATIQDMTEFDWIVRKKIGNRRTDAEVNSDFEGVFPVNSSELFDDIIDDPTEPFTPNKDIFGLDSALYGDFTLVALVALIVSQLKCEHEYE
jgi:hypothetical protein